MNKKREISIITVILFTFFVLSSSYSQLYSQAEKKENEISE